MLQPVLRRTWSIRAHTPILYEQCSHDRLSVLSALVVSPKRHHVALYFAFFPKENIRAHNIVEFLRQLRRQGLRRFILVLDHWSVHRARKLGDFFEQSPCSVRDVQWLPTYAPELNPVEQVWNNTKYHRLANYTPETLAALSEQVNDSLFAVRGNQHLLRSFFITAELPL